MCSAGLVLGAVGGYASYQGTKMQSAAAQAQYEAQARANEYAGQIADNNAKIAESQAEDAVIRGQGRQIELRREAGRARGTGRTAYAAGNVQLGTGSAMDWEQDFSAGEARERIAIDRQTQMEKWGFQVEAQNYRNQAQSARLGAANAMQAGKIARSTGGLAAVGSLISSAAPFSDQLQGFLVPKKKKTDTSEKPR